MKYDRAESPEMFDFFLTLPSVDTTKCFVTSKKVFFLISFLFCCFFNGNNFSSF